MLHDNHRARAVDAAGRGHVPLHFGHGLREQRLVGGRRDHQVAHVLERPARVVVRTRVARGVALDREINVGHGAERLVAADDVVTRLHVHSAHLERVGGLVKLHALVEQVVHGAGHVALAALRGGNHPAIRGTIGATRNGALVLDPVVVEEHLAILARARQGKEHSRLLDVGVVARAPRHNRRRGIGAEPLATLVHAHRARVGPVALHFVKATDRIVPVRHEEHVVRHPSVIETIRPHSRHAALGHLQHVVLGEHPPLVDRDGVELLVVRARAGRCVQQGLRFVEVVQNGGVPLEAELLDVAREGKELPHAVAIVVVLHVLAPVHQGKLAFTHAALFVVEIVVDHLLAPVCFDNRRDDRDDVVADLLDEGRLLDHEAVRELHQHFGAAALGRVHATREPVERLGRFDECLGLRLGGLARVGERGEVALVLVEILDGFFVCHYQHGHVASFFGLADGPVLGAARGRLGDLLQVLVHVVGLVENAPRADDVAEVLEWRGDLVGGRQVIDQFRGDARVAQELFDELAVFLVLFLLGDGRGRGEGEARESEQWGGDPSRHPAS